MSCHDCKHASYPGFEMFECTKQALWVDGRGIIGKILGVTPWKDYRVDSLGLALSCGGPGNDCKYFEPKEGAG